MVTSISICVAMALAKHQNFAGHLDWSWQCVAFLTVRLDHNFTNIFDGRHWQDPFEIASLSVG